MVSSKDFGILALIGLGAFFLFNRGSEDVFASGSIPSKLAPEPLEAIEEEPIIDLRTPAQRQFAVDQQTLARRMKLFPLSFKKRSVAGEGVSRGIALNQQGLDLLSGARKPSDFSRSVLSVLFRNPLIRDKFL